MCEKLKLCLQFWTTYIKILKTQHLPGLSEKTETWDMQHFGKWKSYNVIKTCITHMKQQVKVLEHTHYRSTELIQSVILLYFFNRISMVFFEGKKGIGK